MTNSYKKESPLAGFPGFGGGAGALYYKSAAADKTYLEDVFSSDVWDGTATARKISNGVKLGNSNAGYRVAIDGRSLLYTSPSPRDRGRSRMQSSA